jgi:hypothetical protein
MSAQRPHQVILVRPGRGADLFLRPAALFDLDNLAAVVPAAVWANMVWSLELPAIAALDEVNRRQEDVPPAVALAVAADALFG